MTLWRRRCVRGSGLFFSGQPRLIEKNWRFSEIRLLIFFFLICFCFLSLSLALQSHAFWWTSTDTRLQFQTLELFIDYSVEVVWRHLDGRHLDKMIYCSSQTWVSYTLALYSNTRPRSLVSCVPFNKLNRQWGLFEEIAPALLVLERSAVASRYWLGCRTVRDDCFLSWCWLNTHGPGSLKSIHHRRCCCRHDVLSCSATARERQERRPRKLKALWRHLLPLERFPFICLTIWYIICWDISDFCLAYWL